MMAGFGREGLKKMCILADDGPKKDALRRLDLFSMVPTHGFEPRTY